MTFKKALEKMDIPKETRKQLINDKKLNKYTIKTMFETETMYSKQTVYFLITEEGKAFEIPTFAKLDKETMDVSHRLYKDMIIDQVFDNNRAGVMGEKKTVRKRIKGLIRGTGLENSYEVNSDKTMLKKYTKAIIKEMIKKKKNEIKKIIELRTKELKVLDFIKNNLIINMCPYSYKQHIFLNDTPIKLNGGYFTIGKKTISKELPTNKIISIFKKVLTESKLRRNHENI